MRLDSADVAGSAAAAAEIWRVLAVGEALLAVSVAPRWEQPLGEALSAAGASLRWLRTDEIPIPRATQGTGLDRLLGAWRAHRLCGGAALVASLGTAFTIDAVDARGEFRGGAIGPGLGVQEAALAAAAPHLPAPDPAWNGEGIPDDSASAVACGTRGALAATIEATAAAFAATLGASNCARFLTGGDAERLAPLLATNWLPHPDLVLAALSDLAPHIS